MPKKRDLRYRRSHRRIDLLFSGFRWVDSEISRLSYTTEGLSPSCLSSATILMASASNIVLKAGQ
jgi:hypothetical protein